jgi:hypothetical protein
VHVFLSVELNVAVDKGDYIVELSKIESKREYEWEVRVCIQILHYDVCIMRVLTFFYNLFYLFYVPYSCAGINVTCSFFSS